MPKILARLPTANLYVVGAGALRTALEAYVHDHALAGSISFLGRIKDEDLIEWYRKCKISVVPSLFEGLGLSALEGMACGTPVIASDVPGLSDVIRDRIDGLLFKSENEESLVQSIISLLTDAELYGRLRENAIARVREVYSWDVSLSKYEKLFDTTCKERPPRSIRNHSQ